MARWPLFVALAFWAAVSIPWALAGHYGLETNGFDLSVFDYALWSTLHGRLAFVPFFGYSLFAQHFMPSLLALLPLYALVSSPVLLIVLQYCAVGAAAALLWRVCQCMRLDGLLAVAVLIAFLFSRSTHSAVSSVFYIESLEPLLVVALWLSWRAHRHWLYAGLMCLALGCKEDMGLYLAVFGLLIFWTSDEKRIGLLTLIGSLTWTVAAVLVIIPHMREVEGLSAVYPFLAFSSDGPLLPQVATALRNLFSWATIQKVFTLTAATGLTCWVAPRLLLPMLTGVVIAGSGQALSLHGGFSGHYLWPLLPWLWLAAIHGVSKIHTKWPTARISVASVLIVVTVANSPFWMAFRADRRPDLAAAQAVRNGLREVPEANLLAMQPNLIPHMAHTWDLMALGGDQPQARTPDVVVLTSVGNLWPLQLQGVKELTRRFSLDPRFEQCSGGALVVFSEHRCSPRIGRER